MFSVDASVRTTLIDRGVPSFFKSAEHLLRYHARFGSHKAPRHSQVRERNRDDRLVEQPRLGVVSDHEAIPAPAVGDEFAQGRQTTAVNRVRGLDLDRHEPDVPLEDEVDLRAGRGAIKEGAAVEPSPFQLPENLLAHHRLP